VRDFEKIRESHLIPKEFIEKEEFHPSDYKDFLFARAELFCQKLRDELPDLKIRIINGKEDQTT